MTIKALKLSEREVTRIARALAEPHRLQQVDVGLLEDVKRLFAETKRAFDKLVVLVNNAGLYQFGNARASVRS